MRGGLSSRTHRTLKRFLPGRTLFTKNTATGYLEPAWSTIVEIINLISIHLLAGFPARIKPGFLGSVNPMHDYVHNQPNNGEAANIHQHLCRACATLRFI